MKFYPCVKGAEKDLVMLKGGGGGGGHKKVV